MLAKERKETVCGRPLKVIVSLCSGVFNLLVFHAILVIDEHTHTHRPQANTHTQGHTKHIDMQILTCRRD